MTSPYMPPCIVDIEGEPEPAEVAPDGDELVIHDGACSWYSLLAHDDD
jgi:hypothetical protein